MTPPPRELRCRVVGLSVLGPGLPGWAASAPVLAGAESWQGGDAPFTPPPPALLPPTERRRTSPAVRLALAAAAEAAAASGLPPAELDTVFASSNGDGQVVGAILEALSEPGEGVISPTQFHNSVHNAAAGYWGIAVGSARPSVSLGGHDQVFAAGLLQAAVQVAAGGRPVLLVCYDAPLAPPLAAVRRTDLPFAAGLVLAPPADGAAEAEIALRYVAEPAPTIPAEEGGGLDALAAANPAARALPLLRAVAARRAADLVFPLLEDARLELRVAPPC